MSIEINYQNKMYIYSACWCVLLVSLDMVREGEGEPDGCFQLWLLILLAGNVLWLPMGIIGGIGIGSSHTTKKNSFIIFCYAFVLFCRLQLELDCLLQYPKNQIQLELKQTNKNSLYVKCL